MPRISSGSSFSPSAVELTISAKSTVTMRRSSVDVLVVTATGFLTYQPDLVCQDHGLDAVAQIQLVEKVGDMGLDRGLADVELRGYLGVGKASRDLLEDVGLAVGQGLELLCLSARDGLGPPCELF